MELRDYQKECIDTIERLPDGARSVVAIATGLGKTALAAHIPFKGRMLWLSHRDELVRQPEKYFAEQGYTYGVEKADEHSDNEDVVSASVQSLSRDTRLHSFKPDDFDVIICDEAHHAAAPTYRKILDYFKPRKLIGLTATPKRGDGARLTDVFDDICFSRDLKWGITNGYLSRIRCIRVKADFDMDKLRKQAGDYAASDLEKEMEQSNDDIIVAKAYNEYCVPDSRQTLIYCPTLKVCKLVESTIRKSLPQNMRDTVVMLSQQNSEEERRIIIEKYRNREIHCIVNCMILTEGTDLPETSVIINNRPSANSALYAQIVGRGTRLSEGKDHCLVIDIVGDNSIAKDICTAPTLFGIDPERLPERVQKQLENTDLLEISEAFANERAATVRQAQIAVEMVDIFTQQREDLITKAFNSKDDNIPGLLADSYREMIETKDDEYDFGDILVKKGYDDTHYYTIKPSFEGLISMSKPDMLGKTVVTIDIPEISISTVTEPMTMEAAISYIEDILMYAMGEFYVTTWSKQSRTERKRLEASEKQQGYIFTRFASIGHPMNGHNLARLNRLQAGDLIDLYNELIKADGRKKRLMASVQKLQESENSEKKKTSRRKKKTVANDDESIKAKKLEHLKQAWERDRKKLDLFIDKGKTVQSKREAEFKKLLKGEKCLRVAMDYRFYMQMKSPVSQQQQAFVNSLLFDIKSKGGSFDVFLDPWHLGLDKWHAGLLINALITIKNNNIKVPGKTVVYGLKDYLKTIKNITSNSATNPKILNISVSVK